MPNIVAFLSNKLTLRGTEVAIFDYADYNEKYLVIKVSLLQGIIML
jgi:hypothetical protein